MSVTSDGKKLALTPDANLKGVAEFKNSDVVGLELFNGKEVLHASVNKGIASLPAGSYQVQALSQLVKADNGSTYYVSAQSAPDFRLVVENGKTTTITCSKKAKLRLSESTDVFNKEFTLTCSSPEGFDIYTLLEQDAKGAMYNISRPTLTIVDSKGTKIYSETFAPFSWKHYWVRPEWLPSGVYTVKATWDSQLYGELTTEIKLELK